MNEEKSNRSAGLENLGMAFCVLLVWAGLGLLGWGIAHPMMVLHRLAREDEEVRSCIRDIELLRDYVFSLHPVAGECVGPVSGLVVSTYCCDHSPDYWIFRPYVPYRPADDE